MTLREFILKESCAECEKPAKDFDGEEPKAGKFVFDAKVTIDAEDEDKAKDALKDALADFDAEIKAHKETKEQKDAEADEDDEEEGEAAKKHEGCCPQCGKKFSECTCK